MWTNYIHSDKTNTIDANKKYIADPFRINSNVFFTSSINKHKNKKTGKIMLK